MYGNVAPRRVLIESVHPGLAKRPGYQHAALRDALSATGRSIVGLQHHVLELHGHAGRAFVQLQGDDAGLGGVLLVVIRDVGGLVAVDEVLEVVALGDDLVVVPVAGLDERL